jgi:glutaredoxin
MAKASSGRKGRCAAALRLLRLGLIAFAVALGGLQLASASEPSQPAVHVHVFLSATCPHCELVEEAALRRLSQELGCAVVPHYYDVDLLDQYERMVVLERRMGDTDNDLPVVFLGEHVLGGVQEVEARLPGLLAQYRETGLAPIALPTAEEARARLREAPDGPQARIGPVRLAYFEEPGCRQCARVERILNLISARLAQVEVRRFSTRTGRDRLLLEVLCERAGVPPSRRLIVPAVFVGHGALIREEISDAALYALCTKAGEDAAAAIWEAPAQELAAAEERLWRRASGVSLVAVTVGGLVDGVNPCAFATLVFLVCCLAGAGQSRRTILTVGACFTLGVFIAYFVTGLGLGEALLRLDALPRVSQVLTWAIIAATFALGAVSFWDFAVAVRGDPRRMKLKLPHSLRMRINSTISRRLRGRSVALAALGVGASVSLIEFVCTGQVYFPLIRYMTTVSATRLRAMGLLVLYDLAFVVPLVAVFLAAYFGLSSERLSAGLRRHAASSKLLLAAFFLGLGGLLLHMELGRIL